MSKIASASLVSSVASARNTETTPLDPAILFSGICLLALVVAIVFGEPGIWF
jgi:hypothetical protein